MFNISILTKILEETEISSLDGILLAYCAQINDPKSLRLLELLIANKGKAGIEKQFIIECVNKKILDGSTIQNIDYVSFGDIYPHRQFAEKYLLDQLTMGQELLKTYPNTTVINGRPTVLKKGENINGTYYDTTKLCELYCQYINHDTELHKKIIWDLQLAVRAGLINFAFRSFVLDKMWESLPELLKASETTNTFDTVTDA